MAFTTNKGSVWRRTPAALAACILINPAWAQSESTTPQLPAVVVTEHLPQPAASVTGFGNTPLAETPISAQVIDARQIEAVGARRLADLLQFDASASDAYNAVGYWDYATVRGFVLDNRFNYRREGLPINAETFIALDNKASVQVLKGTSGMQAGTSAPGGLIEYAVKRPTAAPLRHLRAELNDTGGALLAVDLSDHLGPQSPVAYRLNLAAEHIGNTAEHSAGQRQLAALALDWQLGPGRLLQAEFEWSNRSQPSVTGLSLLGTALPAPNPHLNINSQVWSQPVVLQGSTGSVKFTQRLDADWRWHLQAGTQRLTSQDRTAFPYGCTGADGSWTADRFCANGDFDLYDYRSENEHRQTDAAQWQLQGATTLGGVRHQVSGGVTLSRTQDRYQPQAYNWVATQNVDTLGAVAPDPSATSASTQRDERSTEWLLTDVAQWTPQLQSWLGVRFTHLHRSSVRTDGTEAAQYGQNVSSPWAALSYRLGHGLMAYASGGRGAQSQMVPNRPGQFTNAGVALAPMMSRQWELGLKRQGDDFNWQADVYDITQPVSNVDTCNRLYIVPCTVAFDGSERHRGLELWAQWRSGAWLVSTGASALRATREGSRIDPASNGQAPTNVPQFTARAQAEYRVASIRGLSVQGHWSHEGPRKVLPNGSISLPAWNRLDASLRYLGSVAATPTTWTLGITNLLNARYFKESPYQFGHVYLFPGAARQLRISAQASL